MLIDLAQAFSFVIRTPSNMMATRHLRALMGLRRAPYLAKAAAPLGRAGAVGTPGTAYTPLRIAGLPAARFFAGPAASKVGKAVGGELDHEKEQYEAPSEMAKFLKDGPWTFENKDGDVELALVRTMDNRTVKIDFQLTSPYDEGNADEEEGAAKPEEGEEDGMQEATDFTITVESKEGDKGITFYCSTQAGEGHRFVIGNVKSFSSATEKDGETSYNGPEFEDLDEKVQEALDEYLAELGMNDDVCDFIDAAALDKEQREYVRWLGDVKAFVEA